MGYDQSTYVFYGIEIEDPGERWYQFLDHHQSKHDKVIVFESGATNTGEYVHKYVVLNNTLKEVSEGNHIMMDAINITDLHDQLKYEDQILLPEFCEEHNLVPIGIESWFVASWGS